jgi:hypothetical protein
LPCRYLERCQIIGGLASPILLTCYQEYIDTCTSFKHEDCAYTGQVVFSTTSVADANDCQLLLITTGSAYGGKYFVYDSYQHLCTFYDDKTFSCSAFSGPDEPDLDDCQ